MVSFPHFLSIHVTYLKVSFFISNRSEVGTIFSLSWLITWFGHVLNDLRHIVRCYDFFIACHPLMPIYLAAAVSTQGSVKTLITIRASS